MTASADTAVRTTIHTTLGDSEASNCLSTIGDDIFLDVLSSGITWFEWITWFQGQNMEPPPVLIESGRFAPTTEEERLQVVRGDGRVLREIVDDMAQKPSVYCNLQFMFCVWRVLPQRELEKLKLRRLIFICEPIFLGGEHEEFLYPMLSSHRKGYELKGYRAFSHTPTKEDEGFVFQRARM